MLIFQALILGVVMISTAIFCNKSPQQSSEEAGDTMPSHQTMYYWPKQQYMTNHGVQHPLPVQTMDPSFEHAEHLLPTVTTQRFSKKSSPSLTPSMLMFSTVPSLAVSVLTFPMTLSKFCE